MLEIPEDYMCNMYDMAGSILLRKFLYIRSSSTVSFMYREVAPPAELSAYIDAYWFSAAGEHCKPLVTRILPDTCTDILINLGTDIYSSNHEEAGLGSGKAYLLGTMTKYADVKQVPGTFVYGIRFKPFGMNALLRFSLSGTADSQIELAAADFDFKKFIADDRLSIPKLNSFFMQRLQTKNDHHFGLFRSILNAKGIISISDMARKHHLSERQLERIFADKTGVTIKELCSQVRMRNAISAIKNKKVNETLLDVSLATGFCDHAHLTKNLKQYTGYTPSEFFR